MFLIVLGHLKIEYNLQYVMKVGKDDSRERWATFLRMCAKMGRIPDTKFSCAN